MRTHVRFKTTQFAPLKPEEQQVNPGVYGEELAKWIYDHIGKYGVEAVDYFGEDWGWTVVFGREFPIWIGCGNVYGETDEWLCFCEMSRSFKDRLFRKPPPNDELKKTIHALSSLIGSNETISDIEWFTVDNRGQESNYSPQPFER